MKIPTSLHSSKRLLQPISLHFNTNVKKLWPFLLIPTMPWQSIWSCNTLVSLALVLDLSSFIFHISSSNSHLSSSISSFFFLSRAWIQLGTPIKSIRDIGTDVWTMVAGTVGGEQKSLDDVEVNRNLHVTSLLFSLLFILHWTPHSV